MDFIKRSSSCTITCLLSAGLGQAAVTDTGVGTLTQGLAHAQETGRVASIRSLSTRDGNVVQGLHFCIFNPFFKCIGRFTDGITDELS